MASSTTPLTSTASTENTTTANIAHQGPPSRFTCCGKWMTNTPFFEWLVNEAWEIIDDSRDGRVDEAELYAGLLICHIRIAQYAGIVACFPPSRASCDRTFQQMDANNNKYLNRQEFKRVMDVMCAAILGRMMVYFVVMTLSVPFVGTLVAGVLKLANGSYYEIALRFFLSCVLYYLIVPGLWNCVEKRYGIYATESKEELIPSNREEQRAMRTARRRNQDDYESTSNSDTWLNTGSW